jgi:hypothetical protein
VRAAPPARPSPSLDDVAWRAIDEQIAGKAALPAPLTPVLSWNLLGLPSDRATRKKLNCALQTWMLATDLNQAKGDLPDERWLMHKYARMPDAVSWWDQATPTSPQADEYPSLARSLVVEGSVTVKITRQADGKLLRTEIIRRDLKTPGPKDQRPLFYETLLDEASLAKATALPPGQPTQDEIKSGLYMRQVNFSFVLK